LEILRKKYALFDTDSVLFSAKIDRFLDMVDGMNDNMTPTDALKYLDDYEFTIDNTEMSDDERFSILTSIYVCRHSLNYWTQNLSKDDLKSGYGDEKKKKKKKELSDRACWLCVGVRDAASGALIGVATGPWTGLAVGTAYSVFASYCYCKKCAKYGKAKCQ